MILLSDWVGEVNKSEKDTKFLFSITNLLGSLPCILLMIVFISVKLAATTNEIIKSIIMEVLSLRQMYLWVCTTHRQRLANWLIEN